MIQDKEKDVIKYKISIKFSFSLCVNLTIFKSLSREVVGAWVLLSIRFNVVNNIIHKNAFL